MLLSRNTSNEFAQLLSKSMDTRQTLFSNNILLSAVYLDPRYQLLLSTEDKKNAQKHLLFLHKRINRSDKTDNITESVSVPNNDPEPDKPDHEMEFEEFLKRMDRQTNTRARMTTRTGNLLAHYFNTKIYNKSVFSF